MKILVVDDHPLILEALRSTLTELDRKVTLFDARTVADARLLVAAHEDAELLLLDLGLPGADGFSLLVELREQYPSIPVVVLSASDRPADVMRALDLGAMGYIPKTSSAQVMLSALRLVLSGGVYLPAVAMSAIGQPRLGPHRGESTGQTPRELGLTDRQSQVLALILQGKPNKLICRELDLAEGTVKIHVAAVLRALNVGTRTQAVVEASRLGLQLEELIPRASRP
ncbi:MAG: response regulator transcription factor [Burkholderiales bacterium]